MIHLAITIAIAFGIGIVTFFLVSRKPKFFWPLLIGLPLVASGFMIEGRAVVDEYFLATVLFGGFWAAKRGLVPLRAGETTHLHGWLFLFTVLYLVLQSIRGTIILEDIKIIRWVGYFLLFGALFLLLRKWQFPRPDGLSVARIISLASSVYFGSYLLLGFVLECALGVFRWVPQGTLWAGSAYAVFPIIFSFPAALFLLKTEDKSSRSLGWLTIFLSVLAVGFYESRIGWLALFGMLAFVPLALGLGRTLRAVPGLLFVFGFTLFFTLSPVATPYSWGGELKAPYCHTLLAGETTFTEAFARLTDPAWYKVRAWSFTKEIAETVGFPITPRLTDVDRSLHLKAGFLAAKETPFGFFFGGGTHSSQSALVSPLHELYAVELPGTEIGPVVRTTGLSAILVDFGLVGLVLIVLNLFLAMRALISRGSPWRQASILLFALFIIPLWLSVTDIQDMVIFFLLLMRENAFTFLAHDS